tara:strand:- start:35237 stop:35800 length:564 start_codon:yes stop_codon:yes gene_type:complete
MGKLKFLIVAPIIVGTSLFGLTGTQAQNSGEYAKVCLNTFNLFYEGPGSNTTHTRSGLKLSRKEIGKKVSRQVRNSACGCMQNAFNSAGVSKPYIIEQSIISVGKGYELISLGFDNDVMNEMSQSPMQRHSEVLGNFLRGGKKSSRQQVLSFRGQALRCSKQADPYELDPFQNSFINQRWVTQLNNL